jgi:ATPase subunit of ABC transporter with duplicated ATPase domains
MPLATLVGRSGVPRSTVYRILKGDVEKVNFGHVVSVANALGVSLLLDMVPEEEVIEREVQERARAITEMTQATMALEAQGITDQAVLDRISAAVAERIRARPRRKLWNKPCLSPSQSRAKRPSPTSPNSRSRESSTAGS